MVTKVVYPIDQTGLLASNLISDEVHTTTIFNDRSFHLLTPFYAPFFEESLVVVRKVGLMTTTLTPGADYSVVIPHMMSPTISGKILYSAIIIHDVAMSATFSITYQTFGGGFNFDQAGVTEQISQKVYGGQIFNWSDIPDKADVFPTITHEHDFNNVIGLSGVVNALDTVNTTVDTTSIDPTVTKTITGDFTGSGVNTITLTLADTAVVPGTYNKATIDAKGRVTSGANLTSVNDYNMAFTYIEEPQIITTIGNYTVAPLSHKGAGGAEHANATTTAAGFMSAADKSMLANATTYPISNTAPLDLGTAASGTQNVLSRADHVHNLPATVTTTTAGLMSAADKAKLDGIETGAQINTISDINGKVGAVTFTATEFSLGNVDNTSDADKPISTAQQTAIDAKQDSYVDFSLTEAEILALDPAANSGVFYKATDTLIEYVSDGITWANPLSSGGTTITAAQVRIPTPLYPVQNQLNVALKPLLSAFAFSPLYVSDTRIQREFEVTLATDTGFATPVYSNSAQADSITLDVDLDYGVSYIWRCRDAVNTPNGVAFSNWSTPTAFTVVGAIVQTPTFTLITGSPNDVNEKPFITTSAFNILPVGQDTHVSTTWVIMDSSGTIIYTNANDTVNLTSWEVPGGILAVNTVYTVGVKYNGATYFSEIATYIFNTADAFGYENYLAVAHNSAPYFSLYGKDSDTFIKLADPAVRPSGANGFSYSHDGVYLALTSTVSPYINIYKRTADEFTKLADPATLPTGAGQGCQFSSDGTYLAVAHVNAPRITIYKRSGDTFTKLANPATLPSATANSCHFSDDLTYLAVVYGASPYLYIYKRSGDTFTKLADPATLPTGISYGAAFSPDGTYLAISHTTTPFVTIYKRSGDTFTKLPDPATLPGGIGYGCHFSPDGIYLGISCNSSPFITIYKRSGDTFTKLADPTTLPTAQGTDCAFSPDNRYLAVSHANTPYITIYKRNGDILTKLANPATLPTGIGYGCSWYQIGYGATP